MKPTTVGSRAALATAAVGLGVALASAATPVASADSPSGDGSSQTTSKSANSASTAKTGPKKSKSAKTNIASIPKANTLSASTPKPNTSTPGQTAPRATVARSATVAEGAPPRQLPQLADVPGESIYAAAGFTSSAVTTMPRPLTDTPASPAELLAAAAARRYPVGDIFGEFFRRVDLAITTLVAPVNTLVAELTGTRADDPIPPGACEDGDCNPTSDIYLPFVRNEITVLNLTGKPVTLSSLDTKKPLTYGEQQGYVLDNARQVEMAFYQNGSAWDEDWTHEGTMSWSDGSTTVTVNVEAGGAEVSSSSSNIQAIVFDTPQSISGPSQIALRETLVLLPKAGTEITIPTTDGVGQSIVAAALCKVSGSCGQEVVDEQVRLSAPKVVGNTLFNGGSVTSTNRYKVAQEVTKSNGVEENLKVVAGSSLNFSLGPLAFETEIGALIQQKYGHSWSDGVTTESQVDLDVPPGSYGQIYVQYPEYHDYVNMTLTNSGVTIKIPDVDYVSLAPSGSLDPQGKPVSVTYTTDDWVIGTGPHPLPDSGSVPTPPATSVADTVTPPDIDAPTAEPTRSPKTLGQIIGNYLQGQVQAFDALPNILLAGRAVSSQTFRIVNLTPYAQTLNSITGEYEEDDSPEKGFVLQPFQAIDIEVDYDVFQDQETYVTWTNVTGIATSAELKVFNGGSDPRITCQSAGCMDGGYDSYAGRGIMYLIYPYTTPGKMDVTEDQNLAAAAVNAGCTPSSNGATPGSCGVNATGETYYNAPTSGPVQSQVNLGSQTNSYYYTITTTKSESASWATGGGIKLKEKAGVFVGQQIELEASVLYTGSTQVKDSESSTVVQNLLPDYGGSIYIGDPYLRTYGDYIVNLPNLTMIVTGQWIEAASGLGAQGPVANVVDYPLE